MVFQSARTSSIARLLVTLVAALLVAACTTGSGANAPRDGRAGLKLSGRIDAGPVAISDGSPRLLEGDCASRTGVPADVCFATRGVGGTTYVFGFANLDQIARDEQVSVVDSRCTSPEACAEVDDGAVVLVAVDGQLHRAEGGTLLVRQAERGQRYVGQLVLRVDGGTINGGFDVVDRPRAEPPDDGRGGSDGREPFTPDEVEPYDPDDRSDD